MESIAKIKPQDATTNPSLILKAASNPHYLPLIQKALEDSKDLDDANDRVIVNFGCEILKHIPGRVSTEVDARLSFDTQKTITKAKRLIELYKEAGVDRSRVLIKIAATWEGAEAAKRLEAEGIHCNLTLIFSPLQAEIAANAGATLISPFVGRIYDWYKKEAGDKWNEEKNSGENDPGVKSVKLIYKRLKGIGSPTEIMGASFRNKGQILALAGCDLLTISPALIAELESCDDPAPQQLFKEAVIPLREEAISESNFRFAMCSDKMASEKLYEGIRNFTADGMKLKAFLVEHMPLKDTEGVTHV
ncbi:MAG: transaldolase [Burkholderiales bacterium]|nr:transaldolase [Burkholderiales bacterium]